MQFAYEGFERRRSLADAVGWKFGDADAMREDLPDYSLLLDDITYGMGLPPYYSYACRAVVRDSLHLFERYLFCRVRELRGQPLPSSDDRTPQWPALCEQVEQLTGVAVECQQLAEVRDLRHRLTHRSFGPWQDMEETAGGGVERSLRPEAAIGWLDLLEERVCVLEDSGAPARSAG